MNDKKVIESILDKISSLNGIANSLENEQLKQNLKDDIVDMINHSVLEKDCIINAKKLKQDYLAYCTSKNLGNSFFIWKFITLELWYRKFIINN